MITFLLLYVFFASLMLVLVYFALIKPILDAFDK